ncbi:hypothetical protein [Streptomyces sp. YIM S03343]
MPPGRHRHSPPLHRLLPPSAIAGVSLICAFGPWVFSEPAVLRVFASVAAATAIVGAAVMRRWDSQAGKQVADISRARVSDEWRHEEKAAELETDLDESREVRTKLEQRLRAKRAELAALRNEHAALLRRYATAETERATALEGRRLLEIEAAAPSPEADDDEDGAPVERAGAEPEAPEAEAPEAEAPEAEQDEEQDKERAEEITTIAVFSPEGSKLFLRAKVALSKLADDGDGDGDDGDDGSRAERAEAADETPEAQTVPSASDEAPSAEEPHGTDSAQQPATGPDAEQTTEEPASEAAQDAEPEAPAEPEAEAGSDAEAGRTVADEHEHEHERAGAASTAPTAATPATADTPAKPAHPVQQPSGHFTVPTAVAVVPGAPARRHFVEGGFDFFGTQKGAAAPTPAMESAQNEHRAGVEGQEALAVHKPESEAAYKPAQEGTRAVGQVIDLTAHDETEHIDLKGLRTAAS